MPLFQIKAVLPALMEGTEPPPAGLEETACEPQQRLIEAAIRLFSEPKGLRVRNRERDRGRRRRGQRERLRHFPSKEALFTAVVENLCQDTADRFAQAVAEFGGPEGVANDPGKTAFVFGRLITRAMPILLELGARARRGDGRASFLPPVSCALWPKQLAGRSRTTLSRLVFRSSKRPLPLSSSGPWGPIG